MPDRIRWEQAGTPPSILGYVGTLADPWLFAIWTGIGAPEGKWQLICQLPGLLDTWVDSVSTERLKADAERILAEFVSSLGAVFPEETP